MLAAERIQTEQLASVSSAFLRLRPKLLAPVAPALLLLLLKTDAPRSQVLAIALVFSCMLSFFTWEALRVRKRLPSPQALCRSLLLTVAGLALLCSVSGGPRSPFLVILFAPLGIAFAAFGRTRGTYWIGGSFIIVLSYLAFAPAWWPALGSPQVEIIASLAALLCAVLLFTGVTGLATAYRDTALRLEQMRAELLSASSEHSARLESVGAQVAHELKNPLASIKALVQLVAELAPEQPAAQQQQARNAMRLKVVLDEVGRMENILSDYLGFSRSSTPLQLATHDCRAFFLHFVQLLEGEAARNHVKLVLHCPELQAQFDAGKLRQALLNLAQNALASMPHGGQLTLDVRRADEQLLITLSDDGQGMSPEVLSRVKEPYFSARPGGTGLGVVLANNFVQQHGGSLTFESELGAGTQAHVRLPLVSASL